MNPRPPADAVVALRSLERRFRSTFAGTTDDETADDLALRIGADGRSALSHLTAATRDLTFLGRALQQTLTDDDATLHPAVVDPAERAWDEPGGGTVEEHVSELASAAAGLADRVEHVRAADWARRASVAGHDATVGAVDLLWDAVDSALAHRGSAEHVLREVRGRG